MVSAAARIVDPRRSPTRAAFPAEPPLVLHERRPEDTLGGMLVVSATTKANPLHCRLATSRDGLLVVVLEELALGAATSLLIHVRAATAVPVPHRALHAGGDVAWVLR